MNVLLLKGFQAAIIISVILRMQNIYNVPNMSEKWNAFLAYRENEYISTRNREKYRDYW